MSRFGFGIIDSVTNLFTPDAFERGEISTDDDFRRKTRQTEANWRGITIEDYLRKMDRAGIEHSLLLAKRCGDMRMRYSSETPYERVHEICQKYPDRFSGVAGCDPTRGMAGLRELEKAVREYGFVSAHLYPHWFGLSPDHAKYYPYYAKCCELSVPMMMQVGNCLVYHQDRRLPSVARPITLDQVAIDFPELILIGSHVGWPWHDEMIAMAWKHPNVYIGLDAYAPKHWPPSIQHFINTFGQDKVVFGSDWPVIDPERAVDDVEGLTFRPASLRKMMRDNVIRVFRLEGRLPSTSADDRAAWERARDELARR
jgi:predicted TIM-barrel fold metal-dependent hydrolase